jgi:hypothetical protein
MSLKRIIKSVLNEETYDLGERTNLEKMVAKLIDLKIGNIKKLDNFYGIVVDIFDSQYGKYCQIHFLMKEPFSRDDSDFIYNNFPKSKIQKLVEQMLGVKFDGGFTSSQSTIENYIKTKWFYEDKKVKMF